MTQTTTIAGLMPEYYDRFLLDNLYPDLFLYQLGTKKRLARNFGKVIHFTRYFKGGGSGFAQPFSVTEGTPIGLSAISATQISATVRAFGSAIGVSDFVVMTAVSDVVKGAVFELSKSMALAIEEDLRTTLSGFGTLLPAKNTAKGSASLIATGSLIDSIDIMRASSELRQGNARTWPDGNYAAIIHPKTAFDLRNDGGASGAWLDTNKRTAGGVEQIYQGEVGKLYGVRMVESSSAKNFQGGAASLLKTSAGVSGFLTYVIGPGAFGVVELDGNTASVFVKQVGSAGTADPINQRGSIGVKSYFVGVGLEAARMKRISAGGRTL